MALIKKKGSNQKASPSQRKQIIKINPYENSENVMELMAKICSAKPSADTDLYWNIVNDAYNKEIRGVSLRQYLIDNREGLLNKDFDHELKDFCRQLSWSLATRENTEHTQIVVAGGFSSGKSSFLNRLTNSVNLLPTGVEPVSVVKTYLYCSSNIKVVGVKGVNLKNVLVDLNPGVLQAIQHAKQSNIFLASVLEKLFVEIPSRDLDGLVFIDTPGYNNTDRANESNGKTDKQTALEAMKEGNVLFWLVDCERGTTVSDDIEIIREFNGKKVFIFNKADKKGLQESVKIVDEAARTLYKEFSKEEIIDIIAYSTLENKIYYSKNNKTLRSIIDEVKRSGNGISEMNTYKDLVAMLFDDEIVASRNTIKDIEEAYKERVDWKNKSQKMYQEAKEFKDTIEEELTAALIDNYNEVLRAADNMTDSARDAINAFSEFYDGVMYFENNDHWGSSSCLTASINKANNKLSLCIDKYNSIHYEYYDESFRTQIVESVSSEENVVVTRYKEWYDEACESCKNALDGKKREETIIKDMSDYKNIFMNAIDLGIREYQRRNQAISVKNDVAEVPNVFECIKKNDKKLFFRSFENGVDLSICNAEGYNPLTLAVEYGNESMVQFLLNHDADPAIKDRRGYNAFHTAVENQYRDICKMLLDLDPDLIESKTASGESVESLAKKHTFSKWLSKEIENAL